MILDKTNNINLVLGIRDFSQSDKSYFWNLGNLLLKKVFHIKNKIMLSDPLCCAKAFFKNDIVIDKIKSKSFDIDVELVSILIKKHVVFTELKLPYKRRSHKEGKKLKIIDGLTVLRRIIFINR